MKFLYLSILDDHFVSVPHRVIVSPRETSPSDHIMLQRNPIGMRTEDALVDVGGGKKALLVLFLVLLLPRDHLILPAAKIRVTRVLRT